MKRFPIKLTIVLTALFVPFFSGWAVQVSAEPLPTGQADLPAQPERTIDYTEALIEIDEIGLFDTAGAPIVEWKPVPDESAASPDAPASDAPPADPELEAYQQTILQQWGSKRAFNQERLTSLKNNLMTEGQSFQALSAQIQEIGDAMAPLQAEINSLKDQIELFNRQIGAAEIQIQTAEQRIVKKQLDIKALMLDLKKSEIALAAQQQQVLEFIKLMYREEERYLTLYADGADTLKLLLADNSVSESLQGAEYMRLVQELGRDFFNELKIKERVLSEKQADLNRQHQELAMLFTSLSRQKEYLQVQRLAKKELLDETQGQESTYQAMLEEAIRQQMESAIAIQNLRDNIEGIESKLALLDERFPEPTIEESQGNFEALNLPLAPDDFIPDLALPPLAWPVSPERGISAYFRDPTYPKRWGIHQAVDIRARQGTPIHAPANGYVFETKDNGKGYSYIIVVHKDSLVTVYGHVSEILVKPGELVRKGEIIGLTGGMPGTKGAGLQTTGPHLHLEVYKNGEHIDPLTVLSVTDLPLEYIPEEFLGDF